MEVGGEDVGRITFELRADVAPKTAENFVSWWIDSLVSITLSLPPVLTPIVLFALIL